MWKPEHRVAADRNGLRYPSDLSDAEWAIVEPMIPPARHGGRKRSVNVREVLNGIFYVLWTGCQWKALPKDLPPKSTVHDYLDLWNWDGTLERIHALDQGPLGGRRLLGRIGRRRRHGRRVYTRRRGVQGLPGQKSIHLHLSLTLV